MFAEVQKQVLQYMQSHPLEEFSRLDLSRAVGKKKTPYTVTAVVSLAAGGRIQSKVGQRSGLSCYLYWYDPALDTQQPLFDASSFDAWVEGEGSDGEE